MAGVAYHQDSPKAFALPQKVISQPVQRKEQGYDFFLHKGYSAYVEIDASGTSVTAIVPKLQPPSVSEQIQQIEARLGLNRSQLAKALMVTRKTIYDWCNKGAKLSNANVEERLHKLFEVANAQPDEAMGKYFGVNLQRPVLNGESLLDILTDQTIDADKAKNALQIVAKLAAESKARMEAFARKQPKPLPTHEAQATLDEIAPRT